MSAGLFGLLDDVAALARLAAASVDDVGAAAGRASTKAAGVVIDDTAVTPQYVHGVSADRELPIIKRIAMGSFRNKLVFILPAILLLSQFLPWMLTPILMVGGTYLAYEGAHKVWGKLRGHEHHAVPVAVVHGDAEKEMVRGAVRTDFILSAEIMVIALNEVAGEGFLSRLVILAVVAVGITIAVYGVVALIVKMDDVGLHLAERGSGLASRLGHGLVNGMPRLLTFISAVGIVAMLWVGGHILLVGADELGWHLPYSLVHELEHGAEELVPHALAATTAWLVNTLCSAVVGIIIGLAAVAVRALLPFGKHDVDTAPDDVDGIVVLTDGEDSAR